MARICSTRSSARRRALAAGGWNCAAASTNRRTPQTENSGDLVARMKRSGIRDLAPDIYVAVGAKITYLRSSLTGGLDEEISVVDYWMGCHYRQRLGW